MTLRNRMLRAAAGAGAAPPVATDPYFRNVSLLLNDTGTNGQQNNTFLDSSSNNFTITRNGTPTQGSVTPYWPDGQWSNYFNGSNTFLSASANTAFVLDGSFTVEAWVFLTATPANDADGKARANICNYYQSGSTSSYQLHINKTDNLIFFGRNQSGVGITGSFNVPLNTWVHIAAVYNGTTGAIYVNGTSVTLTTNNWAWVAPSTPTFRVGALTQSSFTHYFPGYISNLRMVKGTAVYTSNFTPSTTPLTAVSGTSLLTCQSNRFKDNSSNNFAITVTGTPTVQAFEPFEPASSYATSVGGSGYFNGTVGNYISAPDNVAFQFGSGDFTIEGWVNLNSLTASSYLMGKGDRATVAGSAFSLPFTGYTMDFYAGSSVFSLSTFTPPLNAWFHIAIVRNGTTITRYINGVSNASVTIGTASINTGGVNEVRIGGYVNSAGFLGINGYISNLRIVKGTAVYTSAFTPPTSPVTAITGTSLLLNCTNAGIYDAATLNDLVTVGNAQVSTAQAKFGSSSMAFDGTGDYLTFPYTPQVNLGSGNFTVEGWVYLSSLSGDVTLAAVQNWGDGYAQARVALLANGSARFLCTSGSTTWINTNTTASGVFTTGNWIHFAAVRNGSSFNLYVNGTSQLSYTSSATLFNNSAPSIVGSILANGTPVHFLNGYLDDLRITKGYARYTANFTPPTAPFPTR